MKYVIISGIALILLAAFVLTILAFLFLKRKIEVLESSLRKTQGSRYRSSEDNSSLKNLYTKVNDIQNTLNKNTSEVIKKLEYLTNKLREASEKTSKQDDAYKNKPTQAPQKQPEADSDPRIWVRRTQEGMLLLEKTDTPIEMYLIKYGEHYLLHLAAIPPEEYVNMRILYNEIIDFPVNVSEINEIIMQIHPKYERQGDKFRFIEHGIIEVK